MIIKRKKILFILNVDYFLISHRLPIALECLKQGYEVHLASQETEVSKEIKKLGIKTHSLRITRTGLKPKEVFISFIDIFNIIDLIKPDILHLISIKPILLGGISIYFIKNKPKIITSVSGLGYVFINKGIKAEIIKKITLFLYKIVFKNKKITCIVQNKDDLNFLSKRTSIPLKNFILIPGSGVDLSKFKKSYFKSKRPIILFPSRLLISKGINEFLEAAKSLKDQARFVISGSFDAESNDSISKAELEVYIKNNTIEYWGYSNNMSSTISRSSIVVLPSYREGLPKVLCEAAACAKPVITTNVPGCREAIINKKTGILIPKQDKDALIKAINILLNNKKYADNLGREGRKLAESKFDINKIVSSHMRLYKSY